MSCNCCFTDFISNCETAIDVNAQLDPEMEYTWVITDKFGKKYSHVFSTDTDGFWQINVSDLPEGFFTQYSGPFKLEVQDVTGCTAIKFKVAAEYDCIDFDVKGGTLVKDTIGCYFTEPVS